MIRAVLVLVLAACGCGGGGAATIDGGGDAPVDGGGDGGPCPGGQVLFTGDYLDWDSTDEDFLGVFSAIVRDDGNPENTAMTAPNGRVLLCVDAPASGTVTFVQADYVTVVYQLADDTVREPFTIKGLTVVGSPPRVESLFADELSLVRDPARSIVLVAVRRAGGGAPVVGAQVTLGTTNDGAFTADAAGRYVPGDTTTNDAFVLFANADPGGGTAPVQVTAPGLTCAGPPALTLQGAPIAATTFVCQ